MDRSAMGTTNSFAGSAGASQGSSYQYRAANHSGSHTYLYPIVSKVLTGLPAGARVLDLGCGNGSFLSLFRNRGWQLYGTDFSTAGIAIATHHFPGIHFVLADATSHPLPEFLANQLGSFDALISTEVIEHLYDPATFLRNAYSLLRPGGILVLSSPYHGYLKNLSLAFTGKLDRHFDALRHHGHIKFFSRQTLSSALTQAGFENLRFFGAGRTPRLWKSMVFRAEKP